HQRPVRHRLFHLGRLYAGSVPRNHYRHVGDWRSGHAVHVVGTQAHGTPAALAGPRSHGVNRRAVRTLALAAGFLVGYHLLLALVVLLRFEAWPNYFHVHALAENFVLILRGTPSWIDAIGIAIQE